MQRSLIEPVGQEPVGIQPFLEEVDRPDEIDVGIDLRQILGIPVGAVERHKWCFLDLSVEIAKLAARRPAAQHDLDTPLHPARELGQDRQGFAAADRPEPTNPPGTITLVSRDTRGGQDMALQIENLVLQQKDRQIELGALGEVVLDEGRGARD